MAKHGRLLDNLFTGMPLIHTRGALAHTWSPPPLIATTTGNGGASEPPLHQGMALLVRLYQFKDQLEGSTSGNNSNIHSCHGAKADLVGGRVIIAAVGGSVLV
jgi:hypothetical protein